MLDFYLFKKRNILTMLLAFLGSAAFGQSIKIDTFRLKESTQFNEIQSDQMNFPVVRSGNGLIDSLINTDLKNRFTYNEYPKEQLDSTLLKWADDRIVFLDFNVTYNQNSILSISISAEGCGAYCSNWTEYFNYSTKTGKWLDISDIVDTTGSFRKMVIKDKAEQYAKAKQSLKDPDWGLSEDEYELTLGYYDECDKSFALEQYALHPDHIEIIENCWLPHVMKPLTPTIELKYEFSKIREQLKIKNVPER